jgi:SagB-type dehydrogenase family enzyme
MPLIDHAPVCPFTLSLRPGAAVHESAGGTITVDIGRRQHDLGCASPGLLGALQRLAAGGATEQQLCDDVVALDGADGLAALYLRLLELSSRGLVCHGVVDDGGRLLTAVPMSTRYHVGPARVSLDSRYVLSRFALLRRDGREMILESPRAVSRVIVHDPRAAALLGALATPARVADLEALARGVSPYALCSCVDLLEQQRYLRPVDASANCDEETDVALAAWEFHDLLLHSRSRRGRHRLPYGATYRLRERVAPLPALKPRMDGVLVPLEQPDLGLIRTTDRSFTSVLEERRSRRRHGLVPITARQLGEFLYRSCRVRRVIPAGAFDFYDATDRVYPSGGAAYALEIYVLANRCDGLTPGLYHYRPADHSLSRVGDSSAATESLLESATLMAHGFTPQVLLVFAARVLRVTWKYSSMAYATILKDVGVLYQTMYLVAASMDLAACALGGGDSDIFAEASGVDYYSEPSVGEFILGTMSNERE